MYVLWSHQQMVIDLHMARMTSQKWEGSHLQFGYIQCIKESVRRSLALSVPQWWHLVGLLWVLYKAS